MKNKLLLGITLVALPLTLAACGSNGKSSANDSSSAKTTMNVKKTVMSKTGEIVGSYNSKDKKVLGATLPGKKVIFTVPKTKGDTTHLHFAFMHAASGSKGWYFAPNSETGIDLNNNSMKSGSTKDITNEIGLFEAPDKNTVKKVTKDSGKLKYENIDKYMSASVKEKNGKYIITIENNSKDDYKTPFSSGVWKVTSESKKSFDQKPSAALSTLATMGHREDLLSVAKSSK